MSGQVKHSFIPLMTFYFLYFQQILGSIISVHVIIEDSTLGMTVSRQEQQNRTASVTGHSRILLAPPSLSVHVNTKRKCIYSRRPIPYANLVQLSVGSTVS